MHRNDLIPSGAVAITKSDSAFVDLVGLFIGGGGDVALRGGDGNTVTFTGVLASTTIPMRVTQVLSAGTTATNIVGYKA